MIENNLVMRRCPAADMSRPCPVLLLPQTKAAGAAAHLYGETAPLGRAASTGLPQKASYSGHGGRSGKSYESGCGATGASLVISANASTSFATSYSAIR